MTNNHVVDKADKIYVKLSVDGGKSTDHGRLAKVIGTDPETDIAVIKIERQSRCPRSSSATPRAHRSATGSWQSEAPFRFRRP